MTKSLIHESKTQFAFSLLCQYFETEHENKMNPKGTFPHKVFFHVLQSECYLSLYIHEIELRGSHCEGTVCSEWLTNLTTDWLGKWLSLMPVSSCLQRLLLQVSALLLTSVVLPSFELFLHTFTSHSKRKERGDGHYSYEEEKVTHREMENWRDEGSKNKTNRKECIKGNEAKRKGATTRSMITRYCATASVVLRLNKSTL